MSRKKIVMASPAGDLQPLARRGLYCERWGALLVADLHLGKETTFRHHGVAVPEGATAATLDQLAAMIAETRANQLWILGDLFHARTSLSGAVIARFERWLATHDNLQVTLVPGNHDVHYQRWPAAWKLEIALPPVTIDRVALAHLPGARPAGADWLICGHLHPAVRLQARTGIAGRQPCFALRDGTQLVLPALGRFTGTSLVKRRSGDRIWVPLGNEVVELPAELLVG